MCKIFLFKKSFWIEIARYGWLIHVFMYVTIATEFFIISNIEDLVAKFKKMLGLHVGMNVTWVLLRTN